MLYFSKPFLKRISYFECAAFFINFVLFCFVASRIYKGLSCSFNLDETATFWTIEDGIINTIRRSYLYLGQSPLYYVFISLIYKLFGFSEKILRFPSFCFIILYFLTISRISCRLFGFNSTLCAMPLIVFSGEYILQGSNMRPYALSLLVSSWSILLLITIPEKPTKQNLFLLTLANTLTIFSHYLYSLIFALHFIIILVHYNRYKSHISKIILQYATTIMLSSPLLYQIYLIFRSSDSRSWMREVNLNDLNSFFNGFLDYRILISSFLLISLFNHIKKRPPQFDKMIILIVWALFAPLFLFSLSYFTNMTLFLSRYSAWHIPAAPFLISFAITSLENKKVRGLFAFTLSLVCLINIANSENKNKLICHDGSREAVRFIEQNLSPDLYTILISSHAESRNLDWLNQEEKLSLLESYLKTYNKNINITILPYAINNIEKSVLLLINYKLNLITKSKPHKIALVYGELPDSRLIINHKISGQHFAKVSLMSLGYSSKLTKTFSNIQVEIFELKCNV